MTERFNGPYIVVPFEEWRYRQGLIAVKPVHDSDGVKNSIWFVCPCGCDGNTRLTINGHLNSLGATWGFSVDDQGVPTITPSIHQLNGCKAHYFITNGMVQWCE